MDISLGTTVNAAWTAHIAIRPTSGSPWTTINALGLSVKPRTVTPPPPGLHDPLRGNGKEQFMISLMDGSGKNVLSFDLKEITNQAGWTYNMAGLNQAVADLTSWIATLS